MASITGFLTNHKHTNSLRVVGTLLQQFEIYSTVALPLCTIMALFKWPQIQICKI